MAGLVAFRLTDVPLDLRARAANRLARKSEAALDPDLDSAASLMARLREMRVGNVSDPEVIKRIAAHPSDRVYWITRSAWERVMGSRSC